MPWSWGSRGRGEGEADALGCAEVLYIFLKLTVTPLKIKISHGITGDKPDLPWDAGSSNQGSSNILTSNVCCM